MPVAVINLILFAALAAAAQLGILAPIVALLVVAAMGRAFMSWDDWGERRHLERFRRARSYR